VAEKKYIHRREGGARKRREFGLRGAVASGGREDRGR
jgi:hypothetical protein